MSRSASVVVGQKNAVTTFDLRVCMKAYHIIWNNPSYFSDHIVMIGSFHLVSAYLTMIGKKMHGYRFTDALSLGRCLLHPWMEKSPERNSAWSVQCHKVIAEGLERLLLEMHCHRTGTDLSECMHGGSMKRFDRLLKKEIKIHKIIHLTHC